MFGRVGVCAQLRDRDAPQLQIIQLSEFELPSSGAPVNQSEEPVGNFSFLQQLFWRVLKRRLHMTPCKLQLVQQLKDADKPARRDSCIAIQEKLEEDGFDDRLVFSDEPAFHVNGKVNKHNTGIWDAENPHEILEHQRDSPKVTMFCAMSKKAVYELFVFKGATVNGEMYLDMLEKWLVDNMSEEVSDDYDVNRMGRHCTGASGLDSF